MLLLVLNAGSSSLKLGLFDAAGPIRRLHASRIDRIGSRGDIEDHTRALDEALRRIEPFGGLGVVDAIGHRIVHGGALFDRPAIITPRVLEELRRLRWLAPLHLPAATEIVEAMMQQTDAPQIGCFDTAFHRRAPRVARMLPLPRALEREGVQRYGFHGLSCASALETLGQWAGLELASGRVVIAHLGAGASLTAVVGGRSLDTTMGFTPASGIPMGTRSGDLDPGLMLYLFRRSGLDVHAVETLIHRQAGLAGVSGSTGDMRDLLARKGVDEGASEAVELFCYQVKKAIGSLAAAMGGIDALVFTGGIGERSPEVRDRATRGLRHLGIELDGARNARSERRVSRESSRCSVWVVPTDEESWIAKETLRLLEPSAGPHPEVDYDRETLAS